VTVMRPSLTRQLCSVNVRSPDLGFGRFVRCVVDRSAGAALCSGSSLAMASASALLRRSLRAAGCSLARWTSSWQHWRCSGPSRFTCSSRSSRSSRLISNSLTHWRSLRSASAYSEWHFRRWPTAHIAALTGGTADRVLSTGRRGRLQVGRGNSFDAGCGARLIRDAIRRKTELQRESLASRHSRHIIPRA
jgi:hypothetical protein